jgi:hypothetical protein
MTAAENTGFPDSEVAARLMAADVPDRREPFVTEMGC